MTLNWIQEIFNNVHIQPKSFIDYNFGILLFCHPFSVVKDITARYVIFVWIAQLNMRRWLGIWQSPDLSHIWLSKIVALIGQLNFITWANMQFSLEFCDYRSCNWCGPIHWFILRWVNLVVSRDICVKVARRASILWSISSWINIYVIVVVSSTYRGVSENGSLLSATLFHYIVLHDRTSLKCIFDQEDKVIFEVFSSFPFMLTKYKSLLLYSFCVLFASATLK